MGSIIVAMATICLVIPVVRQGSYLAPFSRYLDQTWREDAESGLAVCNLPGSHSSLTSVILGALINHSPRYQSSLMFVYFQVKPGYIIGVNTKRSWGQCLIDGLGEKHY